MQPSAPRRPDWCARGKDNRSCGFIDAGGVTADRPWGALDIAEIDQATVRLHWADQPYAWHVNDGPEVFVVLDGAVDMHYRQDGQERVERLTSGRICQVGPRGRARRTPRTRGQDPGSRSGCGPAAPAGSCRSTVP